MSRRNWIRIAGMCLVWTLMLLIDKPLMGQVVVSEICSNGIDDDGDGLVDCYDGDCFGDSACVNGSITVADSCTGSVSGSGFSVVEKWRTDTAFYDVFSTQTPIVGDIDQDGLVEILVLDHNQNDSNITTTGQGDTIFVFNGTDGSLKQILSLASTGSNAARQQLASLAMGDLDGDSFPEIISQLNNTAFAHFEHGGTSPSFVSERVDSFTGFPLLPIPGIADFNGDGNPEIYASNLIFNGQTGLGLANGGFSIPGNGIGSPINSGGGLIAYGMSVAADVLPEAFCADCDGLELVAGQTVYSVNIGTGTLTPQVQSANGLDGFTAIADYDKDGDLDGIIASNRQFGGGLPVEVQVYVWDLQTPTVIAVSPVFTSPTFGNIGQPTVADFDADGLPEVAFSYEHNFVVLDDHASNLSILWTQVTTDESGFTGSTAFDFFGDGSSEIVYKDEDSLKIFDGTSGNILFRILCRGGTTNEKPVVADIDNDGQAEIICACSEHPESPIPPATLSNFALPRLHGYLAVYESGGAPWAPARNLWNQSSYHVTNVNDDLSIPIQQQQHHIVGDSVILNAFNKQASSYDSLGNVVVPLPDLTLDILSIDSILCQNGTTYVEISFSITNLDNNAPAPGPIPIAFYAGDPFSSGAVFLDTLHSPNVLPPNSSDTLQTSLFYATGPVLHAVVNDSGATVFPLTLPNGPLSECNYANNTDSTTAPCTSNGPPDINVNGQAIDTLFTTIPEDSTLTICVSVTDPDLPNDSVTCALSQGQNGSATLQNDTCIVYQPDSNFNGLDTLIKTACDTSGLCDTLVIVIDVTPVNDPPIALRDVDSTLEDVPVVVDVQANDSDPDGDPLTTSILTPPLNGTAVVLNGDSISYTPSSNFHGKDSIQYIVSDTGMPPLSDTAWAVICVVSVNDPPEALNDTLSIPKNSGPFPIDILANDTDPENDPLSSSILVPPSHGTLNITGSLAFYEPDSGYVGQDSFVYVVCDPFAGCDTATVVINIVFQDLVPPTALCKDTTLYLNANGFAVLDPADLDNGSFDDCGIDSMWLSQDTFTMADIGPNNVQLIVLDVGGNLDTCEAEVTVLDTFGVKVEMGLANGFQLFPNPAKDHFILRTNNGERSIQGLKAYDNMGKRVMVQEFGDHPKSSTLVNAMGWSSGFYWLEIETADRQIWMKVMIER